MKDATRLPKSVQALPSLDRRVFELYYRGRHSAAEIAETVRDAEGRPLGLPAVLDALERVEEAVTDRDGGELLGDLAARRAPVSLEGQPDEAAEGLADVSTDPERERRIAQAEAALRAALAQLPPEDALIVSFRYRDGLTHAQVQRALHLTQLPRQRVREILARVRALVEAQGTAAGEFDLGQTPLRPQDE